MSEFLVMPGTFVMFVPVVKNQCEKRTGHHRGSLEKQGPTVHLYVRSRKMSQFRSWTSRSRTATSRLHPCLFHDVTLALLSPAKSKLTADSLSVVSYAPVHSVRQNRPSTRCNSHDWARTADRRIKTARHENCDTHTPSMGVRDCIRYQKCAKTLPTSAQ